MTRLTFSIQYYLRAIGANSVATGIHSVLFPWLVIGVVGASASELGLAQMAILLPNTIFLLFGGVISDRVHRGAWLSLLYMLYIMPLSMLWWFYTFNTLTLQLLIVSGVMFGFLNAFVQPARESLLVFTPSHLIQQSVAKSIVVKFIAQGVGFGLAGLLGYIELSVLLGIQIFMFGLSSFLISRAHRVNKDLSRQTLISKPSWKDLLNALTLFVNNKSFLHLLFLVFATGLLPFGVYLVGMPVLVQQVYDGGAMLLSALQLLFTCGVISANIAVARRATNFVNPGKLMVITFLWRNTCLEALCDEKLTIYRLHLANTNKYNKRLKQLIALADSRKVSIRWHSKTQLARISRNSKQDQGVACDIRCPGYQHYKEIIDCMPLSQTTTLIALDGITNPINLGMIIRSVTASSAFGILLPSRGKPVLSPLAIKASAGTAFKCNILRCEELFRSW